MVTTWLIHLITVPNSIAGALAHWIEALDDPEFKIYRPRQIYTGPSLVSYTSSTQEAAKDTRVLHNDYVTADPIAAKRRTITSTTDPLSQELSSVLLKTTEGLQELTQLLQKMDTAPITDWLDNTQAGLHQTALLAANLQKAQAELLNACKASAMEDKASNSSPQRANFGLNIDMGRRPPKSPDLTKGSTHVRVIERRS